MRGKAKSRERRGLGRSRGGKAKGEREREEDDSLGGSQVSGAPGKDKRRRGKRRTGEELVKKYMDKSGI